MTASVHNIAPGPALRKDWAARIRTAYGRSIEGILDVGRELLAAKEALAHGEFSEMVRRDLPFGERTAQRYMAVARHPVLSDATRVSFLPASLRVLYELSRVEPDELMPELRRIERSRKSIDDWEAEIPALLVRLDCKRAIGRPSVTVQGVQAEVRAIAAAAIPDPEPPTVERPPVTPYWGRFPEAARRIPNPGIEDAEVLPAPTAPPVPPLADIRPRRDAEDDLAGFERLRRLWTDTMGAEWAAASPRARDQFLAWLR